MRRATALLLCLILIPSIPWMSDPAFGGKVVLGRFSDGNATRTFVFDAPGANSSAQLELPKAATIVKASADITGRPYLQNISVTADTRDDFASGTLYNMDINSSEGELRLQRDHSWDDEFDGGALDPRWSWYNTPAAFDLGVNRSGHLHILSPRNVNFNQNSDNGILVSQSISGGFYVETKIVSNPQNNYQKSGIMVRQDANNWFALKYQAQSGQNIQLTTKVGGTAQDTYFAYSASPVYLGVARDGNSFSGRYSSDGVNWTSVSGGPWNVPLTDPARVGLIVADGGSNTDYVADFDYFRLDKYCGNGSLLSGWTEAPGNVTQARATCSGIINPQNTSFSVSARTGPQNPWQGLAPGITTQLSPPGANISYKIEMTSNGVNTPDLYALRINFSIPLFPTDISLGLGQGAPFWTHPGELNDTLAVDMKEAVAAFLGGADAGPDGNVTIPLNISTDAPGTLILQNLTVEYLVGVPPAAPSLRSPASGAFISSTPPVLGLDASDADGDPLLFSVELSDDGFNTITYYNQTTSGAGWSKGDRTYASGEEASLRPSMSFVDGRAYSWRARALDSAYWGPYSEVRNFTVDTSPPIGRPRDEGNLTSVPDSLAATLDFQDNESGVETYEYWIGTGPGAWDVTAKRPTLNASLKATGLSLSMGMTYYFTARARNRAGLWSACATSDGIMYWPAGVEPARIRIEQPSAGSDLSGIAVVSGTSWLRDGWTRNHTVQVRIDDGTWKNATFIGAPPAYARNWTMKWDTTQVLDGNHTVWARVAIGPGTGTEITITNISVAVTNTIPTPPVPVLEADFLPGENASLTIPENSSIEFSFRTDAKAPVIVWLVDGIKRPVDIYPQFVFLAGYTSAGQHLISVIIRSGNLSLQHNWTLNVTDVDQPPVAVVLSPSADSVWKAGTAITFNASSSRDPDLEDRLGFSWVLGDGFALNGSQVVHIYMDPGHYQVVLTVSDGQLESRAFLNLTISAPDKTVQASGGPSIPFLPLAAILIAAAASGGGYLYWSRRRAAQKELQRRSALEEELAAGRPAGAQTGEEGGLSSRTSEISADEVMLASARASADASLYAAATKKPSAPSTGPAGAPEKSATAVPPSAPSYSARAAKPRTAPQYFAPPSYQEAGPEPPSFDEIPDAEAVPMAEVMDVAPEPMAPARTVRPAAPAQISKAPTSARPVAPATPARPATPQIQTRPSKRPETLEEILAALKDH